MISNRTLQRFLTKLLKTQAACRSWVPSLDLRRQTLSSALREIDKAGTGPAQDHQLTTDMAKELSMLQRTEKGKQAREHLDAMVTQK